MMDFGNYRYSRVGDHSSYGRKDRLPWKVGHVVVQSQQEEREQRVGAPNPLFPVWTMKGRGWEGLGMGQVHEERVGMAGNLTVLRVWPMDSRMWRDPNYGCRFLECS